MITFFIDDSGSKEYNDMSQPIFLFSGIAIPNEIFNEATIFLQDKVKELNKLIMDKLISISSSEVKNKDVKKLLKQHLFREFELHANEIMHGKKEYICLNKLEKMNLLTEIFDFIKEKKIKIITIKCDKNLFKKNVDIDLSSKEKQKKFNEEIMNLIIKTYEKYLKDINENGVLIFDNGNDLINNYFREYILDKKLEKISPYIVQANSWKNPLMQMADFVAYISNIYFSKKENFYSDIEDNYEKIKDNVILKEVNYFMEEKEVILQKN